MQSPPSTEGPAAPHGAQNAEERAEERVERPSAAGRPRRPPVGDVPELTVSVVAQFTSLRGGWRLPKSRPLVLRVSNYSLRVALGPLVA